MTGDDVHQSKRKSTLEDTLWSTNNNQRHARFAPFHFDSDSLSDSSFSWLFFFPFSFCFMSIPRWQLIAVQSANSRFHLRNQWCWDEQSPDTPGIACGLVRAHANAAFAGLVMSALFGLAVSIKFHAPGFLGAPTQGILYPWLGNAFIAFLYYAFHFSPEGR